VTIERVFPVELKHSLQVVLPLPVEPAVHVIRRNLQTIRCHVVSETENANE
jgi:hypothetical protein